MNIGLGPGVSVSDGGVRNDLQVAQHLFGEVLSRWDYIAQEPDGALRADPPRNQLPELIAGLTEHLRWLDQLVADWGSSSAHPAVPNPAVAIAQLGSQKRLPFNRKERYFTGTVLPMIVASDGFAHLGRFLRMCGIDEEVPADYLGSQDLQFFTEYSFRESVFNEADKKRFPDLPATKDTPDLVLTGTGWLLAVEAKMYQRPNKRALETQLEAQSRLVRYIADRLDATGTPIHQVRHIALVPEAHRAALNKGYPLRWVDGIITWEELATQYHGVGPRYWTGQLEYANSTDLTATGASHADGFRTGEQISAGAELTHSTGEAYLFMGCRGGLDGKEMGDLLRSGEWRTKSFQVRRAPYPHGNWFPITAFQHRVMD